MWNSDLATELQWWQQLPEGGVIWGDWPQDVASLDKITEDQSGIIDVTDANLTHQTSLRH